MDNVLALIPARAGSKGIPGKNFKPLAGRTPLVRAAVCAWQAGISETVVSSDHPLGVTVMTDEFTARRLDRPAGLAQDDTPMIDVVKHALAAIPGPPDQIILLVQPTQPLRQPKHLQQAVALLQETQADSVVSVVELPRSHSYELLVAIRSGGGYLHPCGSTWSDRPQRRQDAEPSYLCDGTVYAFRRHTVTKYGYGTIYGKHVRPLIIPAEETCALDTPEDWAEAERRLSR